VPRNLVFAPGVFDHLTGGLGERGEGRRESGAFLLGTVEGEEAQVTSLAFYDDLDPNCLTGGISFASEAYGRLWDICEERGARVVADAHTHPSSWVTQSGIDRAHPMLGVAGHVALIFPNYSLGEIEMDEIGVHDYLGEGRWDSSLGTAAATRLVVQTAPKRKWWQLWRR
jgi:proteasome lid subunit RPN8/RPN11